MKQTKNRSGSKIEQLHTLHPRIFRLAKWIICKRYQRDNTF